MLGKKFIKKFVLEKKNLKKIEYEILKKRKKI